MLKLLTRRPFPALVLLPLFLFAAAPALGARHSRHAATRAMHHHMRHHRRAGRRAHHRHAAVRRIRSRAATATSTSVLIGDTAVESNLDYVIAGQAEAFRLQAATSGAAGVAHVYIDSNDKASTLIVGLYSNASNHPGSLLSTGSVSSLKLGAWNTVSVTPAQLSAGATYWLAVLGKGGTLRYRDRKSGPCPSETSAQTTLSAMPTSWKTGTVYPTCPVSGYITAAESVFSSPTPVEPVVGSPTPVEPVVTAPTSTAPPTIGGIATMGGTLTATSGTWSGTTPIAYAYQWQDCDSSGAGCANVSGATSASYALGSGDVGHTVRVVVTASNSGGTASATSAATAVVVAPAPTASFTFTPAAPLVGQAVTFGGSGSTCPDGPCAYAWSDDGGTTQPIPALWPLGSGQILSFTFSGAGTKYVRLVVTDATGQTATVEHNVVVEASSSPPPAPTAPSNTAPPSVSGTAQVGQTLTASSGTWSGSTPMSYAYQWQDCGSAGESCSAIGGATASVYTLAASDVGHEVRVAVTASNSGGSMTATSQATASVTEATGTPTNCFSGPSRCGYPDPTNTGVEGGVTLTAHSSKITVTKEGETIKNLRMACAGCMIEVEANNVTIENVEIVVTEGEKGCESPCGNAQAIKIAYNSNTKKSPERVTVKHVNCHGAAEEGENATTFCFKNEGGVTNHFEYDYGYNSASCFWGAGTYENNYCYDNANLFNGTPKHDHYETIYYGGGGDQLVMRHNTLFNPHVQTAAIFTKNDEASLGLVVIADNFLAGGGYLMYGLEAGTFAPPTGQFTFTGNRSARCLGKPFLETTETEKAKYRNEEVTGHHLCEGGPDSHGYFPYGGSYGSYTEFPKALTIWSGNYWDDNLEAVAGP